jgi:hypothetical protein
MILSMADPGSLFVGHGAIGLGSVFHLSKMALLLVQSIRLSHSFTLGASFNSLAGERDI